MLSVPGIPGFKVLIVQAIEVSEKTTAKSASQRYLLGHVKPGLRYDRHIKQVVEELERTDAAVGNRVAVRTWRPPEPSLEEPEGLPNRPRRPVRQEFDPYGSAAASR